MWTAFAPIVLNYYNTIFFLECRLPQCAQWAKKLKKVQAKKLVKSNKSKIIFREIAFLAVLNFFPVQKLNTIIIIMYPITQRPRKFKKSSGQKNS